MATWSSIRNKLENEYLAESLRGHIQYFVTRYRKSHDQEGCAAIRFDGKELTRGCYWNKWAKAHLFPHDEKYERRINEELPFMDNTALELGIFDQRLFYDAFYEFDSQRLEKSLVSENALVRIFGLLDRRLGKRRLIALKEAMESETETVRLFYALRISAEGICLDQASFV